VSIRRLTAWSLALGAPDRARCTAAPTSECEVLPLLPSWGSTTPHDVRGTEAQSVQSRSVKLIACQGPDSQTGSGKAISVVQPARADVIVVTEDRLPVSCRHCAVVTSTPIPGWMDRNGHEESASWPKHSRDFLDRQSIVWNMFQNVPCDGDVNHARLESEIAHVALEVEAVKWSQVGANVKLWLLRRDIQRLTPVRSDVQDRALGNVEAQLTERKRHQAVSGERLAARAPLSLSESGTGPLTKVATDSRAGTVGSNP